MKKILAVIVSAMVVVLAAVLFIMPDKDFSEKENRKLASFPKFSVYTFKDASYMKDISSYLNDQFPFRDIFMGIKTSYEKNVLRKKEINNIYICGDGYYIEKYNTAKNTENVAEKIDKFAQKTNADIDIMLVPTASRIYSDKLPKYAQPNENIQTDEAQMLLDSIKSQNISKINVVDILEQNSGEYLYYRLDHHWTSRGAYLAYTEYCRQKGVRPQSEESFEKEDVSNDFYGTIYSKVNDYSIKNGDTITAYSKPDWDIDVLYDGEPSKSIYNRDYLDKKDKYSFFLDNLHAEIKITNNNADNDKSIAVVKDSFANCFVPFLIDHYKNIYVFDTRYYRGSVADFVNQNGIENVLLLFNMNTVDTESAIMGLY